MRISNGATEPIWIVYQAPRQVWPQKVKIEPGMSADYIVPKSISATRFWPKYGCDDTGSNCTMGESGGPELGCPPRGCSPPIDSKFEATFGASDGNDWYDASQVDGWTLPYKFDFKCGAKIDKVDCSGLKENICPTQNIDGAGTVSLAAHNPDKEDAYAGCYSPCAKLTYSNWNNPSGRHSP